MSIARFFNVYGPRQAPIYAVSRPLHMVLNNKRPELHAPGNQTRCFTYVDDAIDGLLAISGVQGVFNIGSTQETEIRDLVDLICAVADFNRTPIVVPNPYQDDIQRRVPDTRRISALGWKPKVALEYGIAKTVAWAHSTPGWIHRETWAA